MAQLHKHWEHSPEYPLKVHKPFLFWLLGAHIAELLQKSGYEMSERLGLICLVL